MLRAPGAGVRLSYRITVCVVLLLALGRSSFGFGSSPSQYFFNRADFPVGQFPHGVALADMNGDGRTDLVVANSNVPSISVLLGQPDGTLGVKTDYPTSAAAGALVTADFNGDGKMDVAVTSINGVDVLIGNGDGTLGSPISYASQARPFLLATADFNHDGKADLAAAGECGTTCGFVSILLGKGDGTFRTEADYPAGGVPSAFAIADLNGDGVPDFALANQVTNSVNGGTPGLTSVLLGVGDGTFRTAVSFASGNNIEGIAVGDVTGDKIPDLIVTHVEGPMLTLQKGNGDGTFQAEQQLSFDIGLISAHIVLIDLNRDGQLDLLLSSVYYGGAVVLMGNGNGTFQSPQAYATGPQPYFFATADVNGDRDTDIAMIDSQGNYATILLGNGDGTFSPRKTLPVIGGSPYVGSGVLGDFNSDGKIDVAVDLPTQGVISVAPGNGDGSFGKPVSTPMPQNFNQLYLNSSSAADFNRDGHLDLLVSGTSLMLGKGDGTFGPAVTINSDTQIGSFVVGDFNRDGKPDVVDLGNGFTESQPLQVLLGNGDGTFQPVQRSWNLASIPRDIIAGDLNGDGILDLALILNPTGVAVLLGHGDGTFANPVIYATDDLPNGINIAELNGDGKLDLMVTGAKVDVFLGKGDGTFPNRVDYAVPDFPQRLTAGDFDGDGKTDIAVDCDGSQETIQILFGTGDGTFQKPIGFIDGGYLSAPLLVTDLNGDHVDDLIVAGGVGSTFVSAPLASVSPSSIDFGAVFPGTSSDSKTVTVTNSGTALLHVSSATVGTPFSIGGSVCGESLGRLQNCMIPIVFSPTATGTQQGQVQIEEDAPDSKLIVLVAGTGTNAIAALSIAPMTVDFKGQDVNTPSAAQTITLTNPSTVPLSIASITVSGPFAEVSQCGSTLAASTSCSVAVVYTPSALGQQTGALTIKDSASGSPQNVPLSGTGVAALSVAAQSGGSLSATVTSGQAALYNLALTAGPDFNGSVSLACSGAPAHARCSITPLALDMTAGQVVNFTVLVATGQQVAMHRALGLELQLAGLGLASCFVLFGFSANLRRDNRGRQLSILIALLGLSLTGIGCGGSSSAATMPSQANSVAVGSYQLTVTATAGNSTTTQTLTLVVN